MRVHIHGLKLIDILNIYPLGQFK